MARTRTEEMPVSMTALVNYAAEPLCAELREMPLPHHGETDVLLRVEAVGVCGSDLHQYHGKHSWKVNYPVVLGHEFSGTVVAAGSGVEGFAVGDRVVSETAAVIDANSPLVRAGIYNLDPNRLGFGYGVNGAMARYVAVPQRCLHAIPDHLSFELAALTEPCCVAYSAVCINARIRPGDSVVVLGPGPIGLLCATLAGLSGARPLVVVGTPADHKRLQVARLQGATHTVSQGDEAALELVRGLGDGYGVDVVIDAAGVSATLELGMSLVRPGGQIVKVGWGPQPCNFSLDPLVQKGVTLQGSFSHNYAMWEKVIAMLASGQLNLQHILGRVDGLESWREAFHAMHSGEVVKAVLKP